MLPFELTKDTPYLALSGELWSVFYEYFNSNWSCYKGFLLYKFCDFLGIFVFVTSLHYFRKSSYIFERKTSLEMMPRKYTVF